MEAFQTSCEVGILNRFVFIYWTNLRRPLYSNSLIVGNQLSLLNPILFFHKDSCRISQNFLFLNAFVLISYSHCSKQALSYKC